MTQVGMWSTILQRTKWGHLSLFVVALLRMHPTTCIPIVTLTLSKHQIFLHKRRKEEDTMGGFSILNSSPKGGYLPQENSCLFLDQVPHHNLSVTIIFFNQKTKTTVHRRLGVDLHYKALKQQTFQCFPQNHVQAIPFCNVNKKTRSKQQFQ